MPRADFLTGLVIFALGIYMACEGLKMPGAGGFIEAGGEPGRVPIMLGLVLALLALILVARAVSRGGHKWSNSKPLERDTRIGVARSALAATICCLYALVLIGATFLGWEVKYSEATFLFLLVFVAGFEWQHAPQQGERTWSRLLDTAPRLAQALISRSSPFPKSVAPYLWLLLTASLQAALVTAAVTYLFEQQFYVKLP